MPKMLGRRKSLARNISTLLHAVLYSPYSCAGSRVRFQTVMLLWSSFPRFYLTVTDSCLSLIISGIHLPKSAGDPG